MICANCNSKNIIEIWIPYRNTQNRMVHCGDCRSHDIIMGDLEMRMVKIDKIKDRI